MDHNFPEQLWRPQNGNKTQGLLIKYVRVPVNIILLLHSTINKRTRDKGPFLTAHKT